MKINANDIIVNVCEQCNRVIGDSNECHVYFRVLQSVTNDGMLKHEGVKKVALSTLLRNSGVKL